MILTEPVNLVITLVENVLVQMPPIVSSVILVGSIRESLKLLMILVPVIILVQLIIMV
jgi:hypothetical protein